MYVLLDAFLLHGLQHHLVLQGISTDPRPCRGIRTPRKGMVSLTVEWCPLPPRAWGRA
jgi:hypothetical protein